MLCDNELRRLIYNLHLFVSNIKEILADNKMNHELIENLGILARYYKKIGDQWRTRTYQGATVAIRGFPQQITDIKQVKNIKGVGKSIQAKIKEFLDTGQIEKVEEIKKLLNVRSEKNSREQIIERFENVWGIGKVNAKHLYKKGMRSIADLKKNQHLLTKNQKIGLKYYEDLQKPITRKYIDTFSLVLAWIFSEEFGGNTYMMDIAGSYRRGAKTSGDIDCLLSSKKFTLQQAVHALQKYDVVTDVLSMRGEKFMGVAHCTGREKNHFRLDIEFLPEEYYGSGLLYFTGSKAFNIQMRLLAKKNNLILNEKGLYRQNGERIPAFTEKEIMNALGMDYVQPQRR